MEKFIVNKIFILLLISCSSYVYSRISPLDPECQQPLGLENGNIKDSQIKVPDGAVTRDYQGRYARLNNKNSWCIPVNSGGTDVYVPQIYIEINLQLPLRITALALQGFGKYSYGNFIKLYHRQSDVVWILYDPDKGKQIKVQNLAGDSIEYLNLQPSLLTNKIKIVPMYGPNVKCLRLELYGCPTPSWVAREYENCTTTNKDLISSLSEQAFEQSAFLSQSISYNAKHLSYGKPYAWCVQLSQDEVNTTGAFASHATVYLFKDTLIYGLQVNGYKETIAPSVSRKYLTDGFKLEYSLDKNTWASYEGGKELKSNDYLESNLTFETPLLAKHIRIRMKVTNTSVTCIKLQIFGCAATKAEGITTTPLTTPNNTNTSTSQARIYKYKTFQGDMYSKDFHFKDTKYPYSANNLNELSNGDGCLTDGQNVPGSSPFKSTCWIGWFQKSTPKPFIIISFNIKTVVKAVNLYSYVNDTMKASAIKMFDVKHGSAVLPFELLGYACAPDSVYGLGGSQDVVYTLDMKSVSTQNIQISFQYAGEWIFLRQVTVSQDTSGAIPLTSATPKCLIPGSGGTAGKDDSPNMIIIIVCVILGLLLLALLIFIIHHYCTGNRHGNWILKFKGPNNKSHFVPNGYNNHEDRLPLNSPTQNDSGYSNSTATTTVPYAKVQFGKKADENRNSDIYAAPDATSEKPGYTQVGIGSPEFAQYTAPDQKSSNGLYAQPSVKQYAEPNQLPNDPIYQGSAIYASTYENPYKAVLVSSLYTDPATIRQRKNSEKQPFKIFPRQQLSFKEKIGVGQFGEVHIALATGLDEIYGTIGHYNSWGLPDTSLVAVKKLMSVEKEIEEEFMKEVEVMSRLKHENVVRLLGISNEQPMLMVVEYMENGDLNQFLRDREPCTSASVRISQIEPNILPLDTLIHMSLQISAGMKYLHSEGFVHRDLATRNCLVGPAYQVKISDFGMSRYLYSKHYYRVEGKAVLPIRWMAPECLYYGKFTQQTDIWSFGVTLWEILSFSRETPYSQLSDPEVIAHACDSVQNSSRNFPVLQKPDACDQDIYEIMLKCWQSSPENRPTFAYLYRFFNDKHANFEEDI